MKKSIPTIVFVLVCLMIFTTNAQTKASKVVKDPAVLTEVEDKRVKKAVKKDSLSVEDKQYIMSRNAVKLALKKKWATDKNNKVKKHAWIKKGKNGYYKRYQLKKKMKQKKQGKQLSQEPHQKLKS